MYHRYSAKQTKKRHRIVEFTDYEEYAVRDVKAEEIAGMYKERWAIESFFRWIKQNLNVPVLFDTTEELQTPVIRLFHMPASLWYPTDRMADWTERNH